MIRRRKTPAELFLGQKLIAPFQKLVMVSDGTEFAVGDIERLFEEARRNAKAKHEKWEKYYNRRRRDVQIKVNDWVLIETHPLSSATKKAVAKLKPKFEGPYRVEVKNNKVVIWKAGKKLTVNVDQVRIYRHRKCDETEIRTGSSDNGSLRDESSGFDRVQRRSNESQYGYKRSHESLGRVDQIGRFGKVQIIEFLKEHCHQMILMFCKNVAGNARNKGGSVRSMKSRGRNDNPYIEERTRSGNRNARWSGDQQREEQERKGASTIRSLSLVVLVGNANYKS
ncbi:uncharacterized protein TNCV_715631 [Trichonephila clavipes]|nr:uncharacterized protein TNCV_715631 [Trichonephila clavipes]